MVSPKTQFLTNSSASRGTVYSAGEGIRVSKSDTMKPYSGTVHKAALSLCSRWEMVGWLGSIATLDMVIEEKILLLLGIVPLLLW